ncbi:hypothetical protein, partial [Bacillus sp. SIMBA_033]
QATEAKQCKPTGANSAEGIVFKREHYIERAKKDNLDLDKAEGMVADEVAKIRSEMSPGERNIGRIEVDGKSVEWRAFMRPNGEVN